MPGMDGFETAGLIRSNPKTSQTPIIFVTAGMKEHQSMIRGYEQGAVDYLIKPLEPVIVQSKVRIFCDLYRQRLTIEKQGTYLEILVADRTNELRRANLELLESNRRQGRLAEKLELATNAAQLGIWDWDIANNTESWNDRMYSLYGVTPENYTCSFEAWLSRVHPDDQARCNAAMQDALRDTRDYNITFRICLPDGSIRHIRGFGKVVRSAQGEPLRMTGVNFDVTESTNATQEIRQHRDHLQELVDERTASLVVAREAADAANLAKSMFLSNMTHELRTPLNSVIGFSRLMSHAAYLTEEHRRDLQIINRSGSHLLALVNDVLELSKIEAGHMSLMEEATDLRHMMEDVVDMLKPRAEQKNIQLTLDSSGLPDAVKVDAIKLRQVLINLLGNAVKFTEHGGAELIGRGTPAGDALVCVEFQVRDTGIGIAASELQHIFEPFVQLITHATTAGTGLGLSISERYVQLLGGKLAADSTPGQGSVFHFSLQLEPAQPQEQPDSIVTGLLALSDTDRGRRILIVDDDPDSRQLLRQSLEPLGFSVAEGVDGPQALELLDTFSPELIILDWHMPRLDGIGVIRQIRSRVPAIQPRIVMLSASVMAGESKTVFEAGGDGFLTKPLEEAKLFALLERLLKLRFQPVSHAAPVSAVRATGIVDGVGSAPDFSVLAPAILTDLRRGASEMNRDTMHSAIAAMRGVHPLLADYVQNMVNEYRYRELWDLFKSDGRS